MRTESGDIQKARKKQLNLRGPHSSADRHLLSQVEETPRAENDAATVASYSVYFNFARVHPVARVTPWKGATGITFVEIVGLLN